MSMKFLPVLILSLLFSVSGCMSNNSTPIGIKESKWLGTMLSVKIVEQSGDVTVYQKIGDTEYFYFKKGVLVYKSEARVPIVLASNPVPAPAAEAPPITLIAEAKDASSAPAPAPIQENVTQPTPGEAQVKHVKVKKPDQMPAAFAAAFNSGSLEQLLSLFEANAVLTPAAGQRKSKSGNLRASLTELLARRGSMKAKTVFATKADAIALVQAELHLSTVDFNGSPVQQTLKTQSVLRQQADGSWLCVIAQPWLPE